ncbi:MAG: hypothetical protein QF902_06955 [Rhodospirillales bacterium]|nr:hypothetical protein [Rhodospirillales bacterium]
MEPRVTMHFFSFIRARAERDPAEFQQWYLESFGPRLQEKSPNMRGHLVNVCVAGPAELKNPHDSVDSGDRYDIVAETWFDSVPEFRESVEGELARELDAAADVQNRYLVSDTVVIDRRQPTPPRIQGYKMMREILFYDDLPDAAAKRQWVHHGELALTVHVGVTHYVQHWVEQVLSPETPKVRGISELFVPTKEDLVNRYYDSPRGQAEVTHDTGHFIQRQLPRVYSHEHVLKA